MDEKINIAVPELIPVVIAASNWGSQWQRRKILFNIDNKAVVDSMNSGLPKNSHLAFLIRKLAIMGVQSSFRYKAVHLPGKFNMAADALSRGNIDKFKGLVPQANEYPVAVSTPLLRELLLLPP